MCSKTLVAAFWDAGVNLCRVSSRSNPIHFVLGVVLCDGSRNLIGFLLAKSSLLLGGGIALLEALQILLMVMSLSPLVFAAHRLP
jgi:hypothetical protein